MKQTQLLLLITIIFMMHTTFVRAQINVSTMFSPEQMVDVLVGNGITYSNVSYTGVAHASGKFWGESNLGLEEGIILTSGKAEIAIGPNNAGGAGFDNNTAGDIDLQALSGTSTNDACVLEFDFIPQSHQMRFQYVFGSEEYLEYVGSINDAFGFFISGPGINGTFSNNSENIAKIPLTNPPVYVTINNINNVSYPQYYVNNSGGQTIQYDGFTTVLSATANVIPCSTYHIKLVIGDAVDGILDSGVFLKAGSFSSGGIGGSVSFNTPFIDTMAVEDCNSAIVAFELEKNMLEDLYIPLEIGGTATNGIDYDTIPDTLFIPAGGTYTSVEITPWEDNLPEGYETVSITYNSSICEPDYKTIDIKIYDRDTYNITAREDTIIHCADPVQLYTSFNGGVAPYFYWWYVAGDTIPFDTIPNPVVNPYNPTEFIVHQMDACGDTLIDTVFVDVIGPTATVSNDTSICLNDFATLTAGGGTSYLWSPTGDTTQSISVSPAEETMYIVTVFDECNNVDQDTVIVYVNNPQAYAGEDVDICIGESTTLTGGGGLSYEWSTGETTQTITVNPSTDECYVVFVTDACDNTATDTVCVYVNDAVVANAGENQTICYGDTVQLSATGGVDYEWNTGEEEQSIFVSPEITTTYYVTVFEGCEDTDSVTVFVNPLPAVEADAAFNIICNGDSVELYANGADLYYWTADPPDASLSGQDSLNNPIVRPSAASTLYTLTGVDTTTGCINVSEVLVSVKEPLSSNFVMAENKVCSNEEINISYIGNATSSASFYWDFDNGSANDLGQESYKVLWADEGNKIVRLYVVEGGCESDTTLKDILVKPTPSAEFLADEPVGCEPFTVAFTDSAANAVPETQYLWFFGTGDSSSLEDPVYTYHSPGEYTVSLQVENDGCSNSKTLENYIQVNAAPQSDFSLSPALTSIKDPEIKFSDNSSSDAQYWLWDMGDGTIIEDSESFSHSFQDTGVFVVTLIVQNLEGCMDTTFKEVYIKPHPRIFAPNAFNPMSTVGNEKFRVRSLGIEKFHMVIFSRWGQKVFETSSISDGWDGYINGSPAPIGTYVYKITYTTNLGQNEEMRGTVTLVQ